MMGREDMMIMLATIENKKLEYKYICNQVDIPINLDDKIRFQIMLDKDMGLRLYFLTEYDKYEFTGDIVDILEDIYIGTETEYVMVGETIFERDEFNFEALKECEING